MYRNDLPKINFVLNDDVRLIFKKYWVNTINIEDYYLTRIFKRSFLGKKKIKRKNNRFRNFEIHSVSEREAKRNHQKVVKAFQTGLKAIRKLGNGNTIDF